MLAFFLDSLDHSLKSGSDVEVPGDPGAGFLAGHEGLIG